VNSHLSLAADGEFYQRCENALLSIKPKLGLSSAKYENFDVRIVSQWGHRSKWSSRELLEAAAKQIILSRKVLDGLGFKSEHYINVLIEKHPGTINSPVYGEVGTSLSTGPLAFIRTPNILGFRSLFWGSAKRDDTFETMPRTLLLKALTYDYNAAFSPFSIAHELAHDTELSSSLRSLIWIEARADFLAYAVTGLSEVIWPAGISAIVYDAFGKRMTTHNSTHRSLKAPRVSAKKELIANSNAYHENSELISSLLFQLSNQFGLELSLNFLRWMDQQEPSTLDLKIETSQREFGPEQQQAWENVIDRFFVLANEWAAQKNPKVRAFIHSEIQKRSE
jgi:hypothetical protein